MTTAVTAERRWLTVDEVAALLAVSKLTVYRRIWAGDLPAIKLGGVGLLRIASDDLDDFLRRSLVGSSTAGAPVLPAAAPANPKESQ